ncbi:hypothetical protein SCLCIDRAFT_90871, partial [Scleroderma citrinum Foug A]
IHKLRDIIAQVLELSPKYFEVAHDQESVPEIQALLGKLGDRKYNPFPPVLFPKHQPDAKNATAFGNWHLLAELAKAVLFGKGALTGQKSSGRKHNATKWEVTKVTPGLLAWVATILNFLLTNDQSFTYTGKGATTGILYTAMFYSYKKFLIMKWDSPFHKEVMRCINAFVF